MKYCKYKVASISLLIILSCNLFAQIDKDNLAQIQKHLKIGDLNICTDSIPVSRKMIVKVTTDSIYIVTEKIQATENLKFFALITDTSPNYASDKVGDIIINLFDNKGSLIWQKKFTNYMLQDLIISEDGSVITVLIKNPFWSNDILITYDANGNEINKVEGYNLFVVSSVKGKLIYYVFEKVKYKFVVGFIDFEKSIKWENSYNTSSVADPIVCKNSNCFLLRTNESTSFFQGTNMLWKKEIKTKGDLSISNDCNHTVWINKKVTVIENSTGNFIFNSDSIFVNNKKIDLYTGEFLENSNLIAILDIISESETKIVTLNTKGKIIKHTVVPNSFSNYLIKNIAGTNSYNVFFDDKLVYSGSLY